MLAFLPTLDWVCTAKRLPTAADANEQGLVEFSNGEDVFEMAWEEVCDPWPTNYWRSIQ